MKKYIYCLFCLVLGSCGQGVFHDRALEKTEEDFWALQEAVEDPSAENPRHVFEQETAQVYPPIFFEPVSVDFTHRMPAEEVLEVLCQSAKIPYLLGQGLEGRLSYHAVERPFLEVLAVLCDALDFSFSYENGLLKIQKDLPVLKTYFVTFLSHTRQSQIVLTNSTEIMAVSSKEGQGNNGSKQTLETKSTQDFWSELETTLKALLPAPCSMTLQRQANAIHVTAPQKIHKKIGVFLEDLQKRMTQQVLIEAKIIEVTLKDAYQGGIDWAQFSKNNVKTRMEFGSGLRSSSALLGQSNSDSVAVHLQNMPLQGVLHFMEYFGTVRTLSSPRITVLHNQNAFLRVAENQIFFDVKYERQFLSGDHEHYGSVVASHSRIQSVPIGLILSVHPVIRPETQEIILTLRPTISRIVGTREDPSVQLMAEAMRQGGKSVTSEIPIVAIREMDSVLKLKSGKTAILGGLMIEGADHSSSGIPGIRRTPLSLIGAAKKSHRLMTELVIFLTATIVDTPVAVPADQRLYQNFTKDPRPLLKQKEKTS
ncbi:MAG: hypothetical protein FJX18_01725 [Alphaproteobacteria bacterium]|nr:hypothetical protein [Alphaproteobacteria bacterium]